MTRRKDYKFHNGEKGAALAIRVKNSRGKSCFSRVLKDGTVEIKLKQGKGQVNSSLIAFIATELEIPQDQIQIVAGGDGNKKLISILDMTPKQIQEKILTRIS